MISSSFSIDSPVFMCFDQPCALLLVTLILSALDQLCQCADNMVHFLVCLQDLADIALLGHPYSNFVHSEEFLH
jgi:hypothetical protein